jgi:hypothetical protein
MATIKAQFIFIEKRGNQSKQQEKQKGNSHSSFQNMSAW